MKRTFTAIALATALTGAFASSAFAQADGASQLRLQVGKQVEGYGVQGVDVSELDVSELANIKFISESDETTVEKASRIRAVLANN